MRDPIAPSRALYIKLGRQGVWERECIDKGLLRFGHEAWPHELASNGDWNALVDWTLDNRLRTTVGTARDAVRQIREFYTAPVDVLWITFRGGRLWWTFSEPKVRRDRDGTKVRVARGGWRDHDINDQALTTNRLSGRLNRLGAYRGTICRVDTRGGVFDYLVRRVNGGHSEVGENVRKSLLALEVDVEAGIKSLTWRDFETLIDLLALEGGWRRVDELGGSRKGIDLVLYQPLADEMMIVSVKSAMASADLTAHLETLSDAFPMARHRVLAIHRPPTAPQLPDGWTLWAVAEIASRTVRVGLADWVMERSL